jgi:hypothetical protein
MNPAPKRRHVVAIITAGLFVSLFAIANIPGAPVVGPSILQDGKYGPHFQCNYQGLVHGWPLTFLIHEGHHRPTDYSLSPWRIGQISEFRPVLLLMNVAFLLLGSIVAGLLVQRHIQKHRWRFQLLHLMAATLVVAMVAAYLTHRSQVHRAQVRQMERAGAVNTDSAEWQPFGPYWLRSLTGAQYWHWADRLAAADIGHSDEIAELAGRTAIRVLRIQTVRCDAMPSLDDYDDLLAIDMFMVNYDYSDRNDNSEPELWPCLHVIAQCDSIQGLNFYDAGVTNRGLQELARMPNLRNLELASNLDVTDEGLVHLASIRSLQKLGLSGTGVTKQGVQRLQTALPHCEIFWE